MHLFIPFGALLFIDSLFISELSMAVLKALYYQLYFFYQTKAKKTSNGEKTD